MVYAWVKDIITKIMALEVLYNYGYGIHTGNYLGRYSTLPKGSMIRCVMYVGPKKVSI